MVNTDRQQESKLDVLWKDVVQYRSGEHFKKILDACVRFRTLAPYNAMLVQMQRPGARFVLTQRQWKTQYNRVPKYNARPIVLLMPFGPVEFVFEIGDTVPKEENTLFAAPSDDDILNEIAEPFKVKQAVPKKTLDTLIDNLAFYGIGVELAMSAGSAYGAKLELMTNDSINITVPIDWRGNVARRADYAISVNRNAGSGEIFAAICHELGHFFCHHLPMPRQWKEKRWNTRNIEHKWEEFEAESVAWLVCERMGMESTSIKYLAGYADRFDSNEYISENVSIERILAAVKEVEKMLKPLSYKDGFLYKHCEDFKQQVKNVIHSTI